MLDVNTILDDRQMRALTGLDMATFCALAEPFTSGCSKKQMRVLLCSACASARQVAGVKAC